MAAPFEDFLRAIGMEVTRPVTKAQAYPMSSYMPTLDGGYYDPNEAGNPGLAYRPSWPAYIPRELDLDAIPRPSALHQTYWDRRAGQDYRSKQEDIMEGFKKFNPLQKRNYEFYENEVLPKIPMSQAPGAEQVLGYRDVSGLTGQRPVQLASAQHGEGEGNLLADLQQDAISYSEMDRQLPPAYQGYIRDLDEKQAMRYLLGEMTPTEVKSWMKSRKGFIQELKEKKNWKDYPTPSRGIPGALTEGPPGSMMTDLSAVRRKDPGGPSGKNLLEVPARTQGLSLTGEPLPLPGQPASGIKPPLTPGVLVGTAAKPGGSAQYPTVKSQDVKDMIISKRITPAGLYEPGQVTDGSKFIYVDFGPGVGVRFMRMRPDKKLEGPTTPEPQAKPSPGALPEGYRIVHGVDESPSGMRNNTFEVLDPKSPVTSTAPASSVAVGTGSGEACGDCMNAAYQWIKKNPAATLVHGFVTDKGKRFPHAWGEDAEGNVHEISNGQNVVVPKADYYSRFGVDPSNPAEYRQYPYHDALVNSVKQRHYGPWDINEKSAPVANPVPRAAAGDVVNYARVTEDVPIDWLKKLPGNALDEARVRKRMEDIRSEGLRDPLVVSVGKISGTAKLGEGNHRLEAARRLGYTHIPVRVEVGSEYGSEKGEAANFKEDLIPKQGEYFKSEASPSEVFKSLFKPLGKRSDLSPALRRLLSYQASLGAGDNDAGFSPYVDTDEGPAPLGPADMFSPSEPSVASGRAMKSFIEERRDQPGHPDSEVIWPGTVYPDPLGHRGTYDPRSLQYLLRGL